MKALFVWDSDYPWDIRVSKICHTLLQHGAEVHLVCRNKLRRPAEEHLEGIHIHRLPFLSSNLGKLNDIYGFPLFFSPPWLTRINKVAKDYKVDLIIVRDLPMAPAALLAGRLRKIPVILDMAECYPELLRLIWKFEPFKISNVLVRNPFLGDIIEKIVIDKINHIWVMIEESRQRLIRKGVAGHKISIVSNTPEHQRFQLAEPAYPGSLQKHKNDLVLVYAGFVNHSRGLDTAIEALPRLLAQNVTPFLVIIGTGSAERSLKEKVIQLGIGKNVSFEGWIDNELIPQFVASSDICLVPHYKCSHWDNTIPNKLFDYMAAGKPVVVSDVLPMQRIVQDKECGLVFQSGSPESLAEQLIKLNDQKLREQLGRNGMEAVQCEYNWSKDAAVLINSLKTVLQNA